MPSNKKDNDTSNLRRLANNGPDVSSSELKIIVGEGIDSRTFYVRESLLCRHSQFFVGAMRMGGIETRDRTFHLADDTPEHFEIFARFVHDGKIYSRVDGETASDSTEDDEWNRLAICWVLGDKLSSTSFKDAICDTVCEKTETESRHPIEMHQTIYASTVSARPIRSLLVDIAVWNWKVATFEERKMDEDWNEFFKHVAIRLIKVSEAERKGIPPFRDPGCKYHEHDVVKTSCYKTMF